MLDSTGLFSSSTTQPQGLTYTTKTDNILFTQYDAHLAGHNIEFNCVGRRTSGDMTIGYGPHIFASFIKTFIETNETFFDNHVSTLNWSNYQATELINHIRGERFLSMITIEKHRGDEYTVVDVENQSGIFKLVVVLSGSVTIGSIEYFAGECVWIASNELTWNPKYPKCDPKKPNTTVTFRMLISKCLMLIKNEYTLQMVQHLGDNKPTLPSFASDSWCQKSGTNILS